MEAMSTRERLILVGMEEIKDHGMRDFSLRRVAKNCGVSCAAPYKHFADKHAMFKAMVEYIGEKWEEELAASFSIRGSAAETAADFSLAYVDFLCKNPHYKSVLMIKKMGLDTPEGAREYGLSVPARRLLAGYRRGHGITRKDLRERIYVARSLVYGAVLTLDIDGGLDPESREVLHRALLEVFERPSDAGEAAE